MRRDAKQKYVCIYCLGHLDADQFNREHVLSEAFGSFKGALVLHECVCRKCNDFFANELELRFARGAFEGMLRYQAGVKPTPAGIVKFLDVEFALPEGDGDWSGVRLHLINEGGELRATLIPQAAFLDTSLNKWVHFTAEEIDQGILRNRPHLQKCEMRIFGRSPEEHQSIISKLRDNGITFQKKRELPTPSPLLEAPSLEVSVTARINHGVRRCITKYALNYLTFVCGETFVRSPDFDAARRFVRYGELPNYPLVATSSTPILFDDQPNARQTDGHLLTVSWTGSLADIVAGVSIFNRVTYHVSLCRQFSGIWRPIRSGVHYSLRSRSVTPLKGWPKDLAL